MIIRVMTCATRTSSLLGYDSDLQAARCDLKADVRKTDPVGAGPKMGTVHCRERFHFSYVRCWKRGQVPIVRSTLRAACGYWYLTPFPAGYFIIENALAAQRHFDGQS